jgi:hypothetical protein
MALDPGSRNVTSPSRPAIANTEMVRRAGVSHSGHRASADDWLIERSNSNRLRQVEQ